MSKYEGEIYLTPKDVSKMLKIGEVKARELMSSGKIKSIVIGERTMRTRKSNVDEYIDGIN